MKVCNFLQPGLVQVEHTCCIIQPIMPTLSAISYARFRLSPLVLYIVLASNGKCMAYIGADGLMGIKSGKPKPNTYKFLLSLYQQKRQRDSIYLLVDFTFVTTV